MTPKCSYILGEKDRGKMTVIGQSTPPSPRSPHILDETRLFRVVSPLYSLCLSPGRNTCRLRSNAPHYFWIFNPHNLVLTLNVCLKNVNTELLSSLHWEYFLVTQCCDTLLCVFKITCAYAQHSFYYIIFHYYLSDTQLKQTYRFCLVLRTEVSRKQKLQS